MCKRQYIIILILSITIKQENIIRALVSRECISYTFPLYYVFSIKIKHDTQKTKACWAAILPSIVVLRHDPIQNNARLSSVRKNLQSSSSRFVQIYCVKVCPPFPSLRLDSTTFFFNWVGDIQKQAHPPSASLKILQTDVINKHRPPPPSLSLFNIT